MAASVSTVVQHVPGDLKEVIVDVTGDTSYPTGGYAISVPGISQISFVDVGVASASGLSAAWDYAAKKLKFFSGATEVTAATNVSTSVFRVAFIGKA